MKKDPCQHLYDELTEQGLQEARLHTAPPRRFRASEAGACGRQIYHRLSGHRPVPRDAVGFMYGYCGDVDHDLTRQLFDHYGIKVDGIEHNEDGSVDETLFIREDIGVELKDSRKVKFTVTCRADGQLDESLLEIKGMGFYPYKACNDQFIKGGHDAALSWIINKKPDYISQCNMTMALTGLKSCYLLLKDRSTGTLGMHNPETGKRSGLRFDFDPDVWETTKKKFAIITRKLEDGEIPRPERTDGSMDCKYCAFYYLCHGANNRQAQGKEPYVLYPGPQVEEHEAQSDGPAEGHEAQ